MSDSLGSVLAASPSFGGGGCGLVSAWDVSDNKSEALRSCKSMQIRALFADTIEAPIEEAMAAPALP